MMKLQRAYIMLIALILVLAGCDKLIYDQPESGDGVEQKVFLSVNIQSAEPNSGLRSINYDASLYEDRVHDLVMVIFKSGTAPTGGERVGVYTTSSLGNSNDSTRAFTAEIVLGKYDFYFVANMFGLTKTWIEDNILDRDDMDSYLGNFPRNLNSALYLGASSSLGFPMVRVYLNQEITPGGNIYQPKPFKPKQYTNETNAVVVNGGGAGTVEKNVVELIRVVAKLEVILDASTNAMLSKISYQNPNRHFRLVESDEVITYATFTTPPELRKLTGENRYIYYMPETIINNSTTWNAGDSNPVINYFTIEMNDGTKYDIPIITHTDMVYGDNYLDFATGPGASGFYSIYRNHHYRYEVKNRERIEIIYQVNPWNKVTRSTYLGYGYNVHIDEDGKVSIHNTVDACPPHEIKLHGVNGTLLDGTAEQTFANYTPGAESSGYQMSNMPVTGEYLEVWFNDIKVKTFTK